MCYFKMEVNKLYVNSQRVFIINQKGKVKNRLLTLFTDSPKYSIKLSEHHEYSLITVIKLCFNIYLRLYNVLIQKRVR